LVNVNVKESWEIEGPVGLAPAAYFAKATKAKERGPTELCVYDYVYDSKAAGQVGSEKRDFVLKVLVMEGMVR